MHLHLRDGAAMADVVGHTARVFARAIVMPNLRPPIVSAQDASSYRERILEALPDGADFEPLMTLYLTDNSRPDEVVGAFEDGIVAAVKLYPAGATTHSDAGVSSIDRVEAVLAAMEENDIPLLVHGELTDSEVDIFDRERAFIDRVLEPLVDRFSGLRVVLEHVSTREGVDFVSGSSARVAATVTPQHLMLNRNALFAGGFDPHHFCLPVVKAERHREAVVAAATGDDPSFFLGTDSAPHPRAHKERRCGSAGIYTAHAALELYAELFEEVSALERLEGFASRRGAAFYGLEPNTESITLVRADWKVPQSYPFGDDELVPFRAGQSIPWRVEDAS
jgi:dihydroorotase